MSASAKPFAVRLSPTLDALRAPVIRLKPGDAKTVGRSPQADIVIDDPTLSRRHALLTCSEASVTLEDLGSTNGVFVNGDHKQTAALQVADIVRFGSVEYRVERDIEAGVESAIEQTMMRRRPSADTATVRDAVALSGLLATSRELMAFTDLPGLLDRVLDRVQPLLRPDRSAILLFDPATDELTPRAVRPAGDYTSVSDFASATAVREAIRARESVEVRDTAEDARLSASESMLRGGIRSALCVPLLGRTGPIGALYADRRSFVDVFTPEQVQVAEAFAAHAAIALETARLYDDRERHFRATLETFAKAIDARDRYTAGHSERVTAYTVILARAVGVPTADFDMIRRAGMLHDIGKVGVPDRVLLKPGPLDAEERLLMEAHVTIGFDMLVPLPFLEDALQVIRGHHERWDGRGYPDRLAGETIHRYARLMAVADSYDAMTSARPYRAPLPLEEAARRLRQDRGAQFEPQAIDAFDTVEAEFKAFCTRACSSAP
jgi:putative nucleotidyltransferase with HDIG domain